MPVDGGNPTPGKPAADTPFYQEGRDGQLDAVRQAVNNLVGGEACSDDEVAATVRKGRVAMFKQQIAKEPESFADQWGSVMAGGLTSEQVRAHADALSEEAADVYFEILGGDDGDSFVDYVRRDARIGTAAAVLRDRAGELGLPPLQIEGFLWDSEKAADYAQREEDGVDRILLEERRIGDDSQVSELLVFRKNADGDWFRLDSSSGEQIKQRPSDYLREHPLSAPGTKIGRYTLATFTGNEFIPRIPQHAKPKFGTQFV